MKTSITCPNCGHRSRTRFGLCIKAKFRYELKWNRIWAFTGSLNDYYAYLWKKQPDSSILDVLERKKGLLGFYCRHCGKEYPDDYFFEILDFIKRMKTLLWLKGKLRV